MTPPRRLIDEEGNVYILVRGDPPAARTHCPRGHPYDDENTYEHKGKRYCRECARERQRRRSKGVIAAAS